MSEPAEILIVDDDRVSRLMIRNNLLRKDPDMEIHEAEDGAEALKIVKERRFTCILLDYNLPDTNGINLIHDIRPFNTTAPVIILTGEGDEMLVAKAFKADRTLVLSLLPVTVQRPVSERARPACHRR